MKNDTTVIEEYLIEAPIIWNFGMKRILRMKFERNATEEETRSILPEVNMEMVTRPKVTCNDANSKRNLR